MFIEVRKILQKEHHGFALYALVALSLAIIVTVFFRSLHYQMHLSTLESLHLYFAKYIAAAISSIEYNLNGFVGYTNIYKLLLDHGTIDDGILKEALLLKDFSSGGIYKIAAMDLGYCTFAKLAFLLFGYQVKSLLYFYFLILLLTFTIFVLEYRKNKAALFILVLFSLAFYLVSLKAIDMQYNVGVIYGFRFMSLLALLPLLHITLFVFSGKLINRKNLYSLFFIIFQSLIITFMYSIRMSAKWMLITVVAMAAIYLLYSWIETQKIEIKMFLKNSLPITLFISTALISKIAIHYNTNDAYKKGDEGSHVFWHSLYVGLALHPEIRKEYNNERLPEVGSKDSWKERSQYRPNDQDAYSATMKWLYEHQSDEYAILNFKPTDNIQYRDIFTFWNKDKESLPKGDFSRKIDMDSDYNWAAADNVLKSVVFDILKKYPQETFTTIFILKPLKFFRIYLNDYVKVKEFFKLKTLFSFNHMSLLIILIVLAFFTKDIHLLFLAVPVLFVSIFSLIIPLIVYPEPWTVPDQASLLTIIIYMMAIGLLRQVFSYFQKKKLNL